MNKEETEEEVRKRRRRKKNNTESEDSGTKCETDKTDIKLFESERRRQKQRSNRV